MKDFTEIRLRAWKELHDLARPNWIYRGQGDASWALSTSLERCFLREGIEGDDRAKLERELLREFRRTYHNYAAHVPEPERLLEWLSLMQHHGAPTRLLDFTFSIYVAAYFAVKLLVNSSLALLPPLVETVRLPSEPTIWSSETSFTTSPSSSSPRLSAATRTLL